jgi:hypothetical protein
LELKFADISKVNLELQKTERELRDQIITSIPKEHVEQLNKKLKVCILTCLIDIGIPNN